MAEKGQIFQIEIIDMTEDGAGIGKADGFPLFVKDAVVGDTVRVEVIKDKKTYAYARILEVVSASKDRVTPACEFARPCGGCQLQALSYEAQLKFKEEKVKNNLIRIGGVSEPNVLGIIGMDVPFRYRNKAEYPVRAGKDGEIAVGFYAGRTHSIIECNECLIGQPGDAKIINAIKKWAKEFGIAPYDEASGKGFLRHVMIRSSKVSDDVMVCLVVNSKKFKFADELTELMKGVGVTSLSYSVNLENTNVIMGREVRAIYGPLYIEDKISDARYRISPLSFYQVNPIQTEKLYATALSFAGLSGNETVWDLYCGIGTISLFLAKSARKVYGVEVISQAIDDARENARLNGISNAEFFVGKAEEVLPEHFRKTGERADVIVVDPPRKGCDIELLKCIKEMAPEKIVYVSCNPATLARDVKVLCGDSTYKVEKVQPVDMFPQTVHVECVVLLSKHI